MAPEPRTTFAEEDERISARAAGKLPASERVTLGLELVEGQGHRGVYYVNVRNADAFLVAIIYSRASILFISLIGAVSAFNTLLFSRQLSHATNLCQLQQLFPSDQWHNVMPVVYYCRFLHLSMFTNLGQLVLCFFALIWALNRRSNLFLLCYALLCIVMLMATLLLGSLFAIDYDSALHQSIQFTLRDALGGNEPRLICRQMPELDCIRKKETSPQQGDIISNSTIKNVATLGIIQQRLQNNSFCDSSFTDSEWIEVPLAQCTAELSATLMAKIILFGFAVEYLLLLSIGVLLSAKLIANRRRRLKRLRIEKAGHLDDQPTPSIENVATIPISDEGQLNPSNNGYQPVTKT